jgi:hypothetical protein
MKKFISALISSIVITACGAQVQESEVSTSLHPDTFKKSKSAFYIDGSITEVKNEASSQGLGLWTDITIEYLVPCTQSFSNFSYNIENRDGKTVIVAAALATAHNTQGQFVCQAFSHHTETVTVPGLLSRDSLELINLKGTGVSFDKEVVGIVPVKSAKVVATRPLCPKGVTCVTDGTIITVAAPILCINQLGPVAYSTKLGKEGKKSTLDLNVSAFEMQNVGHDRVRCAPTSKTFDISLPMIFVDKEDIKLNLLK